jgi:putative ABC transport system ATP-binding protein
VIIVSHDNRIKEITDRVLWLDDRKFKNMVGTAIDPVCGMSLDKDNAPQQATISGRYYYFCANGCRDEFLAGTAQFMRKRMFLNLGNNLMRRRHLPLSLV